MNDKFRELCDKYCGTDNRHTICSVIETIQGTFYVYSCKETEGVVYFSAVKTDNGDIRIYTDLTLRDEGSIMKIDPNDEWIGKEAEDLILYCEAEKVKEAVKTLNMHIANREEILNDPFLRF